MWRRLKCQIEPQVGLIPEVQSSKQLTQQKKKKKEKKKQQYIARFRYN